MVVALFVDLIAAARIHGDGRLSGDRELLQLRGGWYELIGQVDAPALGNRHGLAVRSKADEPHLDDIPTRGHPVHDKSPELICFGVRDDAAPLFDSYLGICERRSIRGIANHASDVSTEEVRGMCNARRQRAECQSGDEEEREDATIEPGTTHPSAP